MQAQTVIPAPGTRAAAAAAAALRAAAGTSADDLESLLDVGAPWAAPGWVALACGHMMSRAEVDYVIQAMREVAAGGWRLLAQYAFDAATGAHSARMHVRHLASFRGA
jgi:hypothetical protein